MGINIMKNTMSIGKNNFHLDSYRWFLLKLYPDLCKSLFIKTITVFYRGISAKRMSYDWDKIFELAKEAGYEDKFKEMYEKNFSIVKNDFYDKSGNLFKAGDVIPRDFIKNM